jgi:hypothetical protein
LFRAALTNEQQAHAYLYQILFALSTGTAGYFKGREGL